MDHSVCSRDLLGELRNCRSWRSEVRSRRRCLFLASLIRRPSVGCKSQPTLAWMQVTSGLRVSVCAILAHQEMVSFFLIPSGVESFLPLKRNPWRALGVFLGLLLRDVLQMCQRNVVWSAWNGHRAFWACSWTMEDKEEHFNGLSQRRV